MNFKTVLFDLDGTLLKNNRNKMGEEYIKLVSKRFSEIISPETFEKALYSAFNAMIKNDGIKNNKEIFIKTFFPMINYPAVKGMKIFDYVHKYDFPSLQKEEEKNASAKEIIQNVFDLGYEVIIATNPIFPADVINERLKWAGINNFPYRMVTSYENSKFSKPNPLYYKEIINQISRIPEECLMVGDEHMDMVAAHIGIKTFFITSPTSDLGYLTPEPTYRGKLKDVLRALKN